MFSIKLYKKKYCYVTIKWVFKLNDYSIYSNIINIWTYTPKDIGCQNSISLSSVSKLNHLPLLILMPVNLQLQ